MSTRRLLAAAAIPLLALTACSASEETANADAEPTHVCAVADGELAPADALEGEPTLEVPLLDGWTTENSLNSEVVRLAIINPELGNEVFVPNIVVTAEASPADEQEALDRQLVGLTQLTGTDDLAPASADVCGYSAWTVDYVLPGSGGLPDRPALVQIIVVPNGEQSITYTLTAQATAPFHPEYEEAVEDIFAGVQINN